MRDQSKIHDFLAAMVSNRRSAEVEGIKVDPRVEDLCLKQFLGQMTGTQVRQEICRMYGVDPELVR